MNKKAALCAKLTPIALALFTHSAYAAENLDTMIVTANGVDTAISDVAATMWVVDQEQIEREISTGADLKVALGRLIPGYDFGGESRTNTSQNLRGRTALIMIDGVSLNSTRAVSRQLESISPFNVARVEVLSGATAIYGAGASGGIINIITKKAESGETITELEIGASSGFNSSDTSGFKTSDDLSKNIAVAVSGGSEKLRGRLSTSYESTGANYDANGDMVLPDITQTDLQFNDTIDIMGNVEYQPDDKQLLSVTAQYYKSAQDTNYAADLGTNSLGALGYVDITISDELDLDIQPSTERLMLNVQYSNEDVLDHNFLAQTYYRNESIQFFPFPSNIADGSDLLTSATYVFSASLQKTETIGAKVVFSKAFDNIKLNHGLDAQLESSTATSTYYDQTATSSGGLTFNKQGEIDRYPDIDTQKIGLFSQADWGVNQDLKVSGGLRYQYVSHEVSDFVGTAQQILLDYGYLSSADTIEGGKTDYSELVANIGTIYTINNNQQLWANLTQGFELPDPSKYYGVGEYDGSGNLTSSVSVDDNSLDAVKTNSLELGWRLSKPKYDVQIATYYSLSDKTTSYDSSTLAIIVNDDQKRIYGIEGQANYRFTDNWYTGFQAHLIKSETKSNGSWSALAAETASPSSALIRGGFDNFDYGAELQWQTLADYSDDAGEELNGYSLMHFSSYYALPFGKISFGIQNLLNKDYYTTWSQRAQIYYGSSLSEDLFAYKGTSRTYAVSYNAEF
ncbi:TonB-dependent receptor [Marinomonas colpomeniae]|uniref:TonB-dependent receptor n=1 Tax=Marinomonas colpomeniae TaxID=2774408 RepID=A0ABR8P042_9GAMM|nr:TonB-dependent receptor [Marinomonas colpomeniae]MBD5770793.1 TonB-dependent receptor [Marinomonas colpomeniae]